MPFSANSRNKTRPYYITPAKRRHAFRPTLTRISSSISGTLDRRSTRPLDRSTPLQQFPNASRNVTRGPFPFFHSHSTSFSPFPLHPSPILPPHSRSLTPELAMGRRVGKLQKRASSPIHRARISNRTVSHFACNGRSHG